jgi:hypothetical protein
VGAEGIDPYYVDLLQRMPDGLGQANWLGFLQSGQGDLQKVGIGFLTSPEFDSLNP